MNIWHDTYLHPTPRQLTLVHASMSLSSSFIEVITGMTHCACSSFSCASVQSEKDMLTVTTEHFQNLIFYYELQEACWDQNVSLQAQDGLKNLAETALNVDALLPTRRK